MTVGAITAVLGGPKVLKRKIDFDSDLRTLTREGLPVSALTSLADSLSLERKTLARVVGVSERTLSRRISHHERLSSDESDRTVRLARVVALAIDTLGSLEKASTWLRAANATLDGQVPLDLLDTDTGVRSVETILGRIAWGVYS